MLSAYRVSLETTNALNNCAKIASGEYISCKHGTVYVVSDDPRLIFDKFGDSVLKVERVGIGYLVKREEEN